MAVLVGETITLEKVLRLASRTGRELQVYEHGRRQVVGCIPYRFVQSGRNFPELEVLMVSSQKGTAMMFPKGGWETDESIEQAAIRESLEEAGVVGTLQSKLGQWRFKSKSQEKFHDGHIFPMHVSEIYDHWPEMSFRQRRWVKADEVMDVCPYSWMREALEILVNRFSQLLEPAVSSGFDYEFDGGKPGRFSDGGGVITCGSEELIMGNTRNHHHRKSKSGENTLHRVPAAGELLNSIEFHERRRRSREISGV